MNRTTSSQSSSLAVWVLLACGVSFSAGLACTALTAPPPPEPISTDTTTAAVASAAPAARPSAPPPAQSAPSVFQAPDPNAKLVSQDLVVGKGAEAKTGDNVTVHYVGTLTDGKEFDSSKKHGQPFTFPLGAGRVIKGWDQGVAGMKVGGKRKLTIPSSLGYGERGAGQIPPNATLVFEVELLEIKTKP